MSDIYEKAKEAANYLKELSSLDLTTGIILGTGLSVLAEAVENPQIIPYSEIPHFPISTVQGHDGKLYIGKIGNEAVCLMSGRFHYYEGYSMQEVSFPVRVMKLIGITKLIVSNISGGLNPNYQSGDIICIEDHINTMPDNPLRGEHDERWGPRFPEMLNVYDQQKISQVQKLAKEQSLEVKTGTYLALQGPNLETKAEYRYMRKIGADMVGMSTVPEVIVAVQMGMEILGLSIISNLCYPPDDIQDVSIEEIIAVANESGKKMSKLIVSYLS